MIDVEVQVFSFFYPSEYSGSCALSVRTRSFIIVQQIFQVVQLISTEILPFASFIPKDFVGQIMAMLNKGSIHSQSSSFTGKERQEDAF